MTNPAATDDRNCDLIPQVLNALAHHKTGNVEMMQIVIGNINHKLMQRGDDPDEFWADWTELCRIYSAKR